MGGGSSPWGSGPDQLWPWGPGVGSAVGGRAHCQGGDWPRFPQRYTGLPVVGGCCWSLIVFVSYYNDNLCNPGTSWAVVASPSPAAGAIHVAVGINVVWAVTKDNKVRKFGTLPKWVLTMAFEQVCATDRCSLAGVS